MGRGREAGQGQGARGIPPIVEGQSPGPCPSVVWNVPGPPGGGTLLAAVNVVNVVT